MASTLYDMTPESGDLIEIYRGTFQHWALYVGDGSVVHLGPPPEVAGGKLFTISSDLSDVALVKKEDLWVVVGTDRWEISNKLDGKHEPRPADVIVKEACELVGRRQHYCVFTNNCEHFVNDLRYGKAESRQVQKAGQAVLAVGATAGLMFGGLALAKMLGGNKSKNEESHSYM